MKNKKALIVDLDNTVYPVKSIGEQLFAPLFELMQEYGWTPGTDRFEGVKEDIMRRPFQKVADDNGFNAELVQRALELLRTTEYTGEMNPYADYESLCRLPADKYLVTTGFEKLQRSKVRQLGIEADFKKVSVVDPDVSDLSKADIFKAIMHEENLKPEDVLVIGDDPESEIAAARSLGMDTFLYEKEKAHPRAEATCRGSNFGDLENIFRLK